MSWQHVQSQAPSPTAAGLPVAEGRAAYLAQLSPTCSLSLTLPCINPKISFKPRITRRPVLRPAHGAPHTLCGPDDGQAAPDLTVAGAPPAYRRTRSASREEARAAMACAALRS
eukprot:scaffold4518_cov410-Prasinococcus_capsulatus_cf.AAC.18